MYKLDLVDRKLLAALDIDSRQPVAALAKSVQLSKQAVKLRLGHLEREGIILSYYAVVNVFKLKRLGGRLWIKLQGNYNEDELVKFAAGMKDAGWVLKLDGAYDLAVIFWSKSLLELDNSIKELNFKFGSFLKDVDVSFIVRAHHISHRYLAGEKNLHQLIMEQKFSDADVDETDLKILAILAKNSRASLVSIGQELGISDKTVKYRIRKLEQDKVILGYMVLLDYSKIGYTWYKVFLQLQNLSAENYASLISFLKAKANVMFVTEAIGISNLEFEAMLETPRQLHELMSEVRLKFPELIKDFVWVSVFTPYKVYYSPNL